MYFGAIAKASKTAEVAIETTAKTAGTLANVGNRIGQGITALATSVKESKVVTSMTEALEPVTAFMENPAVVKTLGVAGVVASAAGFVTAISKGRPGDALMNGVQLAGASTALATAAGYESAALATANAIFLPAAAAAGVIMAGGALANYFGKYCPCDFPKRETHAGIPVCYKENGHSHPVTAKKPHCQWKDYACQHGYVGVCQDLPGVGIFDMYQAWTKNSKAFGDWVVPS